MLYNNKMEKNSFVIYYLLLKL